VTIVGGCMHIVRIDEAGAVAIRRNFCARLGPAYDFATTLSPEEPRLAEPP
jgi:hypothetical protein